MYLYFNLIVFHYTILLFSIADAIDIKGYFLLNIFRFNAELVTILDYMVENIFIT